MIKQRISDKCSELGDSGQGLFVQIPLCVPSSSEGRMFLSSRGREEGTSPKRVSPPAAGGGQIVLSIPAVSQIPSAENIQYVQGDLFWGSMF